jgi:hypothetical protein
MNYGRSIPAQFARTWKTADECGTDPFYFVGFILFKPLVFSLLICFSLFFPSVP